MSEGIDRARDAFDRQAWSRAYEQLSAAARDEPLEIDDLERLASAACLIGRSEESSDVWARAHLECARLGDVARAARCAFWLAFTMLNNGELAQGSGWVDRAQRLLDDRKIDCVEQGYLRYASSLRSALTGDINAAHTGFSQAASMGERFLDAELTTLARIGEGRCLIVLGEMARGVALFDEAMVAVGAREVSPIAVGDAYCTVIDGCSEVFDVRRAHEWTAALSHWCDAQPDVVLYKGQCLVHRAEIMQLHGAWADALEELEGVGERLASPAGQTVRAAASYLRGELHRLRGEHANADDAYRRANEQGRGPQPGLALLRLAQGRIDDAHASIRRVLQESDDPSTRAKFIHPYVEIVLAAQDVPAARMAADELATFATALNQPFLRALSAHVTGTVLLAEEDPQRALVALRQAWMGWRELDAPHHSACVRVLIARACQALGDNDGGEMELDAARSAFADLGAAPDVARTDALSRARSRVEPGGLSSREVEVLALVAQGLTNRDVAHRLFISEKTVASHVSHIFTKLGLSSRAAATAYAYEHGLAHR